MSKGIKKKLRTPATDRANSERFEDLEAMYNDEEGVANSKKTRSSSECGDGDDVVSQPEERVMQQPREQRWGWIVFGIFIFLVLVIGALLLGFWVFL